jgi:hypothetical protein
VAFVLIGGTLHINFKIVAVFEYHYKEENMHVTQTEENSQNQFHPLWFGNADVRLK